MPDGTPAQQQPRPHPAGKMLSLFLLLMLASPLPTLYRLFSTLGEYHFESFHIIRDGSRQRGSGDNFLSLANVISNRESTVEEIMRIVFGDVVMTSNMLRNPGIMLTFGNGTSIKIQLLTMILPWCLSMILGVVIPLTLSIISNRRRRNGQGNKERKLENLILRIRYFKKILENEDFIRKSQVTAPFHNKTIEDDLIPNIVLPSPSVSLKKKGMTRCREVSGTCAICLMKYDNGEHVVWSSNSKCQHVFHEKCILSWLMRRNDYCCPCCRQDFINKDYEQPSGEPLTEDEFD